MSKAEYALSIAGSSYSSSRFGGSEWERTVSSWVHRPGAGYDVGFAGGAPTVVGTNRVCGGYGLYSWNGSSWSPLPGGAIGVSVGPGRKAWVVSETEAIYRQI